jgi:hypothetical protein
MQPATGPCVEIIHNLDGLERADLHNQNDFFTSVTRAANIELKSLRTRVSSVSKSVALDNELSS